jgi:hypothetical protein
VTTSFIFNILIISLISLTLVDHNSLLFEKSMYWMNKFRKEISNSTFAEKVHDWRQNCDCSECIVLQKGVFAQSSETLF